VRSGRRRNGSTARGWKQYVGRYIGANSEAVRVFMVAASGNYHGWALAAAAEEEPSLEEGAAETDSDRRLAPGEPA